MGAVGCGEDVTDNLRGSPSIPSRRRRYSAFARMAASGLLRSCTTAVAGVWRAASSSRRPFAQLAVLRLKAPLHPPQREVGLDPRQNLVEVEGLGDVVDPAGRERLELVEGLRQRADEYHRDGSQRLVLLHRAAHVVPVHLGHVHVEEHDVRWARAAWSAMRPLGTGRTRYPRSLSMPNRS